MIISDSSLNNHHEHSKKKIANDSTLAFKNWRVILFKSFAMINRSLTQSNISVFMSSSGREIPLTDICPKCDWIIFWSRIQNISLTPFVWCVETFSISNTSSYFCIVFQTVLSSSSSWKNSLNWLTSSVKRRFSRSAVYETRIFWSLSSKFVPEPFYLRNCRFQFLFQQIISHVLINLEFDVNIPITTIKQDVMMGIKALFI